VTPANVNKPDEGGNMGIQSPCILALFMHIGIFISFSYI